MTTLESETDRIRRTAAVAVSRTTLFSIEESAYHTLADTLRARPASGPTINPIAASDRLNETQKLCLTLLFSAVNYCYVDPLSGKDYEYDSAERKLRRSTAFVRALIDAPLDWSDLNKIASLTAEEWLHMLRLSEGNVLYRADERLLTIRHVAVLLQSIDTDPNRFFDRYGSYDALFNLLSKMRCYEDMFLKRLQIALLWIRDIALVYGRPFDDKVNLTAMADYRIPQVLYNTGVVKLTPAAASALRAKQVEHGSELEIALRSSAIVATLEIAKLLAIPESEADRRLWNLSQAMIADGKMPVPAMSVKTDCY